MASEPVLVSLKFNLFQRRNLKENHLISIGAKIDDKDDDVMDE